MKAPPCFDDPETKKIIRKICDEHDLDVELLKDLAELVTEFSGSGRRFGMTDEIDSIINRFFDRAGGV